MLVQFVSFAGPDGSPVIIGLTALDSTTVMVKWRPVPENLRNGIVTRYIISYTDEQKEKTEYKSIPAPGLEAIITSLRQKARYSFKIRAATSKGEGPLSGANVTETEGKDNDCDCCDLQVKLTWHFKISIPLDFVSQC